MAADRPVPYIDLASQYAEERTELLEIIDRTMAEGQFVGGRDIDRLEDELAAFFGIRHVIAVNSGTDALYLSLIALGIGPGDEVITPPNSFVASTAVIAQTGATPVFADVLDDQNIDPRAIEAKIGPRTKAIMPVHLTGRVADMDPILALAKRRGLRVIEDAAQAIGSRYRSRLSGTFGDVGCFSAHPLKNLNAAGDGGFIATANDAVADAVRLIRNHGLAGRNTVARWGEVARMDTLQAAILRFRLKRMDSIIARRRLNAALYRECLDAQLVYLPGEMQHEFIAYHTLVIQVSHRNELQAHLAEHGIGTAIHYPIPIHLQPAAARLGYKRGDFPVCERQAERILTLPIHPWVGVHNVRRIATLVNEFLGSRG